jgi:hypothetical protein
MHKVAYSPVGGVNCKTSYVDGWLSLSDRLLRDFWFLLCTILKVQIFLPQACIIFVNLKVSLSQHYLVWWC